MLNQIQDIVEHITKHYSLSDIDAFKIAIEMQKNQSSSKDNELSEKIASDLSEIKNLLAVIAKNTASNADIGINMDNSQKISEIKSMLWKLTSMKTKISHSIEDWDLPQSTPKHVWRKIIAAALKENELDCLRVEKIKEVIKLLSEIH